MAVRTPGTAIMVLTVDQNTLKRVRFGRISNLRSELPPVKRTEPESKFAISVPERYKANFQQSAFIFNNL